MAKFGPDREGQTFQLQLPNDAVGFDAEAFDNILHNQGVQLIHWRSMRCPVGLIDMDDVRRVHDHHEDCSNGFLYTKAGQVTCGFLGNSKESHFIDPGRLDGSTVNVVIPRFYDGTLDPFEATPFDRLYLNDESIVVPTWHVFTAHVTGIDRLIFPVEKVVDLVDSGGNRYHQGVDFELVKGQVHWGSRRPGIEPKTGKGIICSVRFLYRPFWFVKNLVHEIRLAQVEDDFGERRVQRMPQQLVLQREFAFQKETNDNLAPDPEGRQQPGPATGGFGSR